MKFKDSDGNTLLHKITQSGAYIDMIKLIVTLDPEILSIKNDDGDSPLIFHIKQKNYSIVEFLIKNWVGYSDVLSIILLCNKLFGNNKLLLLLIMSPKILIFLTSLNLFIIIIL